MPETPQTKRFRELALQDYYALMAMHNSGRYRDNKTDEGRIIGQEMLALASFIQNHADLTEEEIITGVIKDPQWEIIS